MTEHNETSVGAHRRLEGPFGRPASLRVAAAGRCRTRGKGPLQALPQLRLSLCVMLSWKVLALWFALPAEPCSASASAGHQADCTGGVACAGSLLLADQTPWQLLPPLF